MTPRVVYIVGRSHSGSTLLDLMLSAHTSITSLGEAKSLARAEPPGRGCGCGLEDFGDCDFWQEIAASLPDPDVLSDLRTGDPDRFRAANLALFEAVAAKTGATHVLDASKDSSRLRRLLAAGFDVAPIHLMRDPRGVACSNMRRGAPLDEACRVYVVEHLDATLDLRDRDHQEVHYEELATRPYAVVQRLTRWLGLTPEPAQQRGWRAIERHGVGGNRVGRPSEDETVRLDTRWRTELSRRQQLEILLRTAPVRARRTPLAETVRRLVPEI